MKFAATYRAVAGLFSLLLGAGLAPIAAAQASDLFISEYVEGSSNNKAVEIFNGTGAPVDLGAYAVNMYANGATAATNTVNLGTLQATLESGSVIVLKNSSFTAYAGPAYDSTVANFNGDDVVALLKDGTIIDVIGAVGVRENIFANQTLRRHADVAAPTDLYDAGEWDSLASDTFDGLGSHTFTGAGDPDPEPSAYATDFSAVAETDGSISLSWTDAVGATLPARYVLLVSEAGLPTLPVDGTPVVADADLGDGAAAFLIAMGEEAVRLTGLSPQTEYTLLLIPFTNAGTAVDFKTDGVPPTATVTTALVVLSESFDTLDAWTVVTLGTEAEWALAGGAAQANAFGSAGPADDWLVSGPLDLSFASNLVLRFNSRLSFNDAGFDPALTVLTSSDYDGSGSPSALAAATWSPLNVSLPTVPGSAFVSTGNVSLAGLGGTVYLAFRYQSTGTITNESERWEIDDVVIFPSDESLPALTLNLDLAVVPDDAGAGAAQGTVTIPAALDAPLVVSIANGDSSLLTMPATVTIATGATQAVFDVNVNAGLALVAPVAVAIRVSAGGYTGANRTLTVQPAGLRTLSLTIDPTAVDEDAGATAATGTVTLSRAPASYPLEVTLGSSDGGEATVPGTIRFESAADGLSKTFAIAAVADGAYDADAVVTFTASATDYGVDTATLTVRNVDAPPPLQLSLSAASVFENAGAAGASLTITLGADPLAGYPFTVTLASDLSDEASVAAEVTFTASDNRTRTVPVAVHLDGIADGDQTVTFTATAAGFQAGTATLTVLDTDAIVVPRVIRLLIEPKSFDEGASATVTVLLSTSTAEDLVVDLASGDPAELAVPDTVTVLAGATTAQFTVTGVRDGVIDDDQRVSVAAVADGWGNDLVEVTVRNTDVAPILTLTAVPASLDEGQTGQLRVAASFVPAGGLTVTLGSSDVTELTLPASATIPAGALEVSVPLTAVADGVVDGTATVTLTAGASGYPLATTTVAVVNVDIEKTATLSLRRASVREGETVVADLVLNVPVTTTRVVGLTAQADITHAATITLPAGATTASFEVTAVAGDGFEVDEEVVLRVFVPGYPGAEATLTIVNGDPRGQLVSPVDGMRFGIGDSVLLRATVADPIGTLEAVEFLVDGEVIASVTHAPFVARYEADESLRDVIGIGQSLAQTVSVVVRDATLGDVVLGTRTIELVYLPPRNDGDYVDQLALDLTGALPDEATRSYYLNLLLSGTSSREAVLAEMLDSPALLPVRRAVETMLLVYDRYPTYEELFVEPLLELSIVDNGEIVDEVTMPPMAEVAASGPSTFYGDGDPLLFPGGIRGLAHVLLHAKSEALTRFGGDVATLKTNSFFTTLWQHRHGVNPTAQQIVQAATRLNQFQAAAASEVGDMEVADFARARFVEALVTQETFVSGTDVIYGPPNNRLWDDARLGLARGATWGEFGFVRSEVRLGDGSEAAFFRDLLLHPRYWERFDYMWLNAQPYAEVAGWYGSDWFGAFYLTAEHWPWAFHNRHGWIVVGSDDAAGRGMWWWDLDLGWMWSAEGTFPWMWSHRDQAWLYYQPESVNPRLFWDQKAATWRVVP